MSKQVIVPLVIAKQEDGSDLYLYQGAPVPESLSKDEVKRLSDGGFIGDVKEAASTDEKKAPTRRAAAKKEAASTDEKAEPEQSGNDPAPAE